MAATINFEVGLWHVSQICVVFFTFQITLSNDSCADFVTKQMLNKFGLHVEVA